MRFADHSKAHAWLHCSFREFLKGRHPELYRAICVAASHHFKENRTKRWNLINIALRNTMKLHFTDEWLMLIRRCDDIFGCSSRDNSELGQLGWAIALAIQVKRKRVGC